MIKRFFTKPINAIASAAVIVASFSLLSRIFGFIRDRILAGSFGASDQLDIYFAAFRIPDLFYQLIVTGALSASFIPLFTRYYRRRNQKKAWELTSNVINILFLIFGCTILLAVFIAPLLASVVAPGFSADKLVILSEMMRIMLFAQLILGISMVLGSALQGAKQFILYSMAPIFYNIGIIFGALFFVPKIGIHGLAWGVVFGACMHFLLQWLGICLLGYKHKFILNFRSKDIAYILKHTPPRVMGLAVNQLNFVGMTILASFLAAGSVTVLQFAYNLNFFSVGVIAVSYAIAVFPTLCELADGGQKKKFIQTFSSAVRQMMLFIIPATVLFIALRAQIVRVVLGAGAFTWESTIVTANTLGFFALSLFAQSIIFILVRGFFAYSDTLKPFIIGILGSGVNLGLAMYLKGIYGVAGFGMAYSVAAIIQMILLWIFLRKKVGTLDEKKILLSTSRLIIAGLACLLEIQIMKTIVVQFITLDTFFGVFAQGLIAGGLGLVVFVAIAYFLQSEELIEFIKGMKKRLFKKAKPQEPVVDMG